MRRWDMKNLSRVKKLNWVGVNEPELMSPICKNTLMTQGGEDPCASPAAAGGDDDDDFLTSNCPLSPLSFSLLMLLDCGSTTMEIGRGGRGCRRDGKSDWINSVARRAEPAAVDESWGDCGCGWGGCPLILYVMVCSWFGGDGGGREEVDRNEDERYEVGGDVVDRNEFDQDPKECDGDDQDVVVERVVGRDVVGGDVVGGDGGGGGGVDK